MSKTDVIMIMLEALSIATTIWAIIFGLLLTQIRDEIIKLRRDIYEQRKQ